MAKVKTKPPEEEAAPAGTSITEHFLWMPAQEAVNHTTAAQVLAGK